MLTQARTGDAAQWRNALRRGAELPGIRHGWFYYAVRKKIASALAAAALVACTGSGEGAPLRITSATVAQGVLTARLQWQPSQVLLDALDNGIVLDFVLDLRAYGPARFGVRDTLAHAERHIELRYFPLTRRYQLRDLDRGETRSYAARSLLVAALEDLRLELPNDWTRAAGDFALSIRLDRDRLPGALRLPALLRPEWRLSSEDYSSQTSPAG